ncbi:MAG: glycosyltransferase family 39 protein [Chlamydiales bacterium]
MITQAIDQNSEKSLSSPFFILIVLLLGKTMILGAIITFSHLGLSPDEAQYWTWSQAIDWGYYSKPPAIAWQIWLTTALLGHSEFGVRLGALMVGFLLPLAVYYLAICCKQSEKQAFWSGIVIAFSPLGVYLSLATTTDGGAIFFLTLAIATIVKNIEADEGPNYLLVGGWIFLGALYKWIAFACWPLTFFFLIFFPKMRKWSIISGVLISLVALLPSIYWNISHEWATFKHVGSVFIGGKRGNFFALLMAQVGLLSPMYFFFLIRAFFALSKENNRPLLFCSAFPMAILIYLGIAIFKKIQPNWTAYLYSPVSVLISWMAYPRFRFLLHIGTWLSVSLICFAFIIPDYTFKQTLGWHALEDILKEIDYDPQTEFLMGNKYQTASLLSFYSPLKKRAYFFNISHSRKNQFSYWPQMEDCEKHNTGYFIVLQSDKETMTYEEHYLQLLKPYFEDVVYLGIYPLYVTNRSLSKSLSIFKCHGYLGGAPIDQYGY